MYILSIYITVDAFHNMTTKIQKWGNSLAVRLPKAVIENFKLRAGSPVNIKVGQKSIQIKPAREKPLQLNELVKLISSHNRHDSVDWGQRADREIW